LEVQILLLLAVLAVLQALAGDERLLGEAGR